MSYTYLTTYRYQPGAYRILDRWVSPLELYTPFAPLPTIRPGSSGNCGCTGITTTGTTDGKGWHVHVTPFKTAPTFEVWSHWTNEE